MVELRGKYVFLIVCCHDEYNNNAPALTAEALFGI